MNRTIGKELWVEEVPASLSLGPEGKCQVCHTIAKHLLSHCHRCPLLPTLIFFLSSVYAVAKTIGQIGWLPAPESTPSAAVCYTWNNIQTCAVVSILRVWSACVCLLLSGSFLPILGLQCPFQVSVTSQKGHGSTNRTDLP